MPGLTIEVGPPAAHEDEWFGHELRLTNTSDQVVRIDDNKTSRVLGEPSAILVAEPSCGYIRDESDPGVGTFHYEKTFEYSIGGADEPLEQHTEVVTITYEIDPAS